MDKAGLKKAVKAGLVSGFKIIEKNNIQIK
jgi:hypothetical protein